jgi:hypothetical protein
MAERQAEAKADAPFGELCGTLLTSGSALDSSRAVRIASASGPTEAEHIDLQWGCPLVVTLLLDSVKLLTQEDGDDQDITADCRTLVQDDAPVPIVAFPWSLSMPHMLARVSRPLAGRSADIALTARCCEVARGLVKPQGRRDRSLRSAGSSLVTASRSRWAGARGLEITPPTFRIRAPGRQVRLGAMPGVP